MFSVKVTNYNDNPMLNICDAHLLGRELVEGRLSVRIKASYYGERIVDRKEAESLLRSSSIINMAGEETISLSTGMGIGTKNGIRSVAGVPFLIVFRM